MLREALPARDSGERPDEGAGGDRAAAASSRCSRCAPAGRGSRRAQRRGCSAPSRRGPGEQAGLADRDEGADQNPVATARSRCRGRCRRACRAGRRDAEGNSEQRHDEGDEREGQLPLELDLQRRRVEAARPSSSMYAAAAARSSSRRRAARSRSSPAARARERAARDVGPGRWIGLEVLPPACSPIQPSASEDRAAHERLGRQRPPVRPGREHRQAQHRVALGIEVAVVVDAPVAPDQPAPVQRVQRSRLAAADLASSASACRLARASIRCSSEKSTALQKSDSTTTGAPCGRG